MLALPLVGEKGGSSRSAMAGLLHGTQMSSSATFEPRSNGSFDFQPAGSFGGAIHVDAKDFTLVHTAGAIAAHYDEL